jgi:hypothetical protein
MRRKSSSNEPSTAPRTAPTITPTWCECEDDSPLTGNEEEEDGCEVEDGTGVALEGAVVTEEGDAKVEESTVGAALVGKRPDE